MRYRRDSQPSEMCSGTLLDDQHAWKCVASVGCIIVLIVEVVTAIVSVSYEAYAAINNMIIWSYDHIRGRAECMRYQRGDIVRTRTVGVISTR